MNEKVTPAVRRWGGRTVMERFMSKVNQSGPTPAHDTSMGPCWQWRAGVDKTGYGKFSVGKVSVMAHCFSYHNLTGEIPDGLTLDHKCKNPSCVNPAHLEPVTMRENLLRGNTFQARNARKTHCKNGHPFSRENTIVRPNGGGRACRECGRITHRAWLHKRSINCQQKEIHP